MTTVGQRIREIRKQRNLTQRQLADRVGINFTYLSRVENDRLDDEQTPRADTLQKIAAALATDADELLLLARRIPGTIRERILDKPGIFRRILKLSDSDLEVMLAQFESGNATAVPGGESDVVPSAITAPSVSSISSISAGSDSPTSSAMPSGSSTPSRSTVPSRKAK